VQAQEAVERLSALNAGARRFAEPMVSNFCRGLADNNAMHQLRRDIPPVGHCAHCGKAH
jgi:hypothetical protein